MKQPALTAILLLALAVAMPSAQAQTFIPLHQFNSQNDGAFPEGAILKGLDNNLYGTTTSPGTVFKIDRTGKETILLVLSGGANGIFPTGSLIRDALGNLYGIAEGGAGGAGVVYKVSPRGAETVLFSFQGGLNTETPKLPIGGLVMDASGFLYGTAEVGSNQSCAIGCGSIFKLDQAGNLELLHQFTGGADGAYPLGPLVQDADGNLYGVGQAGGDLVCGQHFFTPGDGCGVVFKLSRNGVFTVLHTFTGGSDGARPQGGLLLDAAGNLYGTALKGGKTQHGTVFRIAKDGTYKILHRFIDIEGKNPNGGLVADPAGNLYGTTQLGGAENLGTVFELRPDGTVKILHAFEGLEDGASPLAGLFRDAAGHLYGTTVHNGLIQIVQGGNVFEIIP